MSRLITACKQVIKHMAESTLFYRDADRKFFEPEEFPWVAGVEAEWRVIRIELDTLLLQREGIPNFHEYSPLQKGITNDRWKTFFLCSYGRVEHEKCERCPETVRMLRKISQMNTAMFSILSPGKYIPPHRRAYKGVLRYHLGLIVPQPEERCRIRVGDEYSRWSDGKSMIFDDTNFTCPTVFPLCVVKNSLLWVRCQRKYQR